MRRRGFVPLSLLALVGLLLVLSAERNWREVRAETGLSLAAHRGGVVIDTVDAGSAADRAGLAPGDLLLDISGQPVRALLAAQDVLGRLHPARPAGFVFVRTGATHSTEVVPETRTVWHVERIAASATALLFLLAAAAALLRPRGVRAWASYVAFSLAGALVLGVSWSWRGDAWDGVFFWIDRGARLALPALFIHLTLALRRGGTEPGSRWLPVVYAPAAALFVAELHLVGLGGALRADDPVGLVDILQSRIELSWIGAGFAAGLVVLARSAYGSTWREERARARWFLLGAAFGLAPFLLLAVLPEIAGRPAPRASWLTLPLLGLLPIVFTGAVLDYRLMDLRFFTRRVVTGVATLMLSVVLFLGLLEAASSIVPLVLHPAGIAPALIAAVITAGLAPAIRAGTRDILGRLFYRRRYNFRRALQRVARDLNAERNLPRLAAVLERRVAEALDAGVVRLLLTGPQGGLLDPATRARLTDALSPAMQLMLQGGETVTLAMIADAPLRLPALNGAGVQVIVPLRVEGTLIATLAVGPRPRGPLLDSDDLDLLRTVAAHAAAAVAGALHLADLREQMQLVERLRTQTAQLVESSPIGMVVIDDQGCVRQWNSAAEDLLGIERDGALGAPFADVLPPALRGVVRELLRRDTGRRRAYRVRIGSGGDETLVDLSATSMHGPQGSEGVLLTLDDVSERVRLEEQLIQQDRLASVGLLAAGVAHEVNTPLTGISSYAQLLLEECDSDDPRRPMLEKIVHQASRASRIARGLLRFSRPSGDVASGPVELRELVEETIGLLGPQIRAARAVVDCATDGPSPFVRGDRARLQQVVTNLLLNGLDAVAPGGHVRVRCVPDGSGRVRLEVEDNGVGIPESLRGRIFDPFFTTKKPGEGTGLGLSITYSIVREHGGTLLCDSEPGRGTTMRVILPAAVPAALQVDRDEPARRAG